MKLTIKQVLLAKNGRVAKRDFRLSMYEIDSIEIEKLYLYQNGIFFRFTIGDKETDSSEFKSGDFAIEEIKVDEEIIYQNKNLKDDCTRVGHKDGQEIQADEIRIKDLGFSKRTFRVLNDEYIETLDQITEHTEKEIMSIRNLGTRGLKEIKDALKEYGLELKK